MGISGQSITLANSIIGVGILAMPYCFQQCGVLLATIMLLGSGIVSRLSCHFLLKSAIMLRRRNFEFLAFQIFGPTGKFFVEIAIIGFLMGTCIAYFVVVGDLGPPIVAKMFNINQSDVLRTGVMLLVSVACVLPLGLLRNVDSLSNVSAATIGFYLCLVLKIIAEATTQIFGGQSIGELELWKPEGVLQCVPIFSMALFCQTQLFEIFESIPSISLEKMNIVTKNALNICTSMYILVGLFGYIAFCGHPISGNVLVSLSPTLTSEVIKMGFVLSLAFSFPLIIFPCRVSLYSLLYRRGQAPHYEVLNHPIPETRFRCITIAIILGSLLVSLMIPNIELVLGLVGSTIGVMICVIFPATCFISVTIKNTNERLLAQIILCFGIIMMVLGTHANLRAAESNLEHYGERYVMSPTDPAIIPIDSGNLPILKAVNTPEKLEDSNFKVSNEVILEKDILNKESEVQPPNPIAPDINLPDISIDEDSKKESEIQPPNPVAPDQDLQFNKDDNLKIETDKQPLLPIAPIGLSDPVVAGNIAHKDLPNNVNNIVHPKNILNKKASVQKNENVQFDTAEGAGDKELPQKTNENINVTVKEIVNNPESIHSEIKEEIGKLIKNSISNQGKIDNIKKQALIDTIIEHDKEQQKLIKEQKEILAEIKKTKLELQKDKMNTANELKAEQAKQIAVESIQKIANIAIQSLEGMSKKENKEKDAIKANENKAEIKKIDNTLKQENILEHEIQSNNQLIDFKNEESKRSEIKELHSETGLGNNKLKQVNSRDHVHSQDEPKSYVQGEDLEIEKNKHRLSNNTISNKEAIVKNIPIPIAMRKTNNIYSHNDSKLQIEEDVANSKHALDLKNVSQPVNKETKQEIVNDPSQNKDNIPISKREKRSTPDCEVISMLSEEERQICKQTVEDNKHDEILGIKFSEKILSLPNVHDSQDLNLDSHLLQNLDSFQSNPS